MQRVAPTERKFKISDLKRTIYEAISTAEQEMLLNAIEIGQHIEACMNEDRYRLFQ